MSYTTNKNLPRLRRDAARLYFKGWSARKIGRYFGYHHTAVMKWVRRARKSGDVPILTRSSRPHSMPRRIDLSIEQIIFQMRLKNGRCAEAIHLELIRNGIKISRNTVHRTLDRFGLLKKRSPYKRFHPHVDRPKALKQGDLVQVDTIHRMIDKKNRLYVFSLIDVYSRRTYAKAYEKMSGAISLDFIQEAERKLGFRFSILQSDHGPEFGRWFVSQIRKNHRYSRIGRPNDNAHIERFNRTLQEECLDKCSNDIREINRKLKEYLQYYNNQRIHLGLGAIPSEVVPSS
jgi:transposase InsO family protein